MPTIEDIDKKIAQLKAQKQDKLNRLKQDERKKRTRRLIEVGAIFEQYFKTETKEQAEELIKKLANQNSNF